MFNKKSKELQDIINNLSNELSYYKELFKENSEYINNLNNSKRELQEITNKLNELKSEYNAIDLCLFTPLYSFETSNECDNELIINNIKQKNILDNIEQFTSKKATINGNKSKGNKLITNMTKLMVQAFNLQCDSAIDKLTANNIHATKKKIKTIYESINKNGSILEIAIPRDLLTLKFEEIDLVFEKLILLNQEKEARAYYKEVLKEQERSEKELIKKQAELEKRRKLIEKTGDTIKIKEIERELNKCNTLLANNKAGWVYIINNPSLGENVYKIGVTRRIDPQIRIDELNNASVPFKFMPNCILYSDDAFGLEAALHREFSDYRVNKINTHKEYFKLHLSEIEKVIKEKYNPNAKFNYNNIDENYLLSGYKIGGNL